MISVLIFAVFAGVLWLVWGNRVTFKRTPLQVVADVEVATAEESAA